MDEGIAAPQVVYEDTSLVAVIKPARMHSVPGIGQGDLCSWTFERYPELRNAGAGADGMARSPGEGGLLHRLDYETSGIVLFARDAEAFASVLAQQEKGSFQKEYSAFSMASSNFQPVGSDPENGFPSGMDEDAWTEARYRRDAATLAALLDSGSGGNPREVSSVFRSFGPRGSRVACISPDGIGADTESTGRTKKVYRSEIVGCSTGSSSLELRIRLSRGFRHQIRAHLAWIGLPISGDALYGGVPDQRLRLHAISLAFSHPTTGEAMILSAEGRS